MQWAHFPNKYFGLLLLTGVAYEGKVNAAELHFGSSFQGYPYRLATWPLATWNLNYKNYGQVGYP